MSVDRFRCAIEEVGRLLYPEGEPISTEPLISIVQKAIEFAGLVGPEEALFLSFGSQFAEDDNPQDFIPAAIQRFISDYS